MMLKGSCQKWNSVKKMTNSYRELRLKISSTSNSIRIAELCLRTHSSSQSKTKIWKTSRSTPNPLGNLNQMLETRTRQHNLHSLTRTSWTSIVTHSTPNSTTTKERESWSLPRKEKVANSRWSQEAKRKREWEVRNRMRTAIAWTI